MPTRLPLALTLLALLGLLAAPAARAQSLPATATPTPAASERPDRCEPNNQPTRACPLPADSVSGPFTLLPPGDEDWYLVELGPPNGLATTITVRADEGLDLLVSLRQLDGGLLTSFATPTISTTLAPDRPERLRIRVENRSPRSALGRAYTVELRATLPPPDPRAAQAPAAPDALENNWDPAHASPIAVETVYDLTLTCPEARPDACPGGDHDYLRFPVKAGTSYLIATFDLGAGVDTALDLFLDDALERPLLSNDDARPGGGLLSALRWLAPRNGIAYLRVAPRTGGTTPLLGADAEGAGSYRLVVALGRSALAAEVEQRIAAQTNAPTRTPTGAGSAPGSAPAATPLPSATATVSETAATDPSLARVVQGDAIKGQAITLAETTVRLRPDPRGEVIQLLPPDTVVTLIGKHVNLWVRVQTDWAVLAGWVLATDLRRFDAPAPTPASAPGAAGPAQPDAAAGVAPTPRPAPPVAPTPQRAWRVTPLAPLPSVERAAPLARSSRTITVSLQYLRGAPPVRTPAPGPRTTPQPSAPIAGVRVQLISALGDLLAEAITPAGGVVTFTRAVAPGAALRIRLPALGLEAPADRDSLLFSIPEGA